MRRPALLLVALLLFAAAVVTMVRRTPSPPAPAPATAHAPSPADAETIATPVDLGAVPADDAPAPTPAVPVGAEDADLFAQLFPEGDAAWAWARVDLEALRAELPDNAFWELAVPDDDPRVAAARRAERDRWNRELGRILSNTATEAENRAFYGERQRISSDYVLLTTRLLELHGDDLPDRDRGLVELARTLHRARLQEIPRRVAEALARREAHERVRAQWLEDEAAFASGDGEG